MPVVSVILTSYNCGPYIGQAIRSILDQSYTDFELLISDDCSTDNSREIIAGLAKGDPRIKYFPQDKNLGLVRNYNFLFKQVRGELVAIQDADDWSDPSRLERQVEVLGNPAFAICATGGRFHFPSRSTRDAALEQSHVIDGLVGSPVAIPASVMFRAALLRQFPGWPNYFSGGTSMDRYFLMELLDGRNGYEIAEALYHARVRAGSSHRSWDGRKMATHQLYLELEKQRRATGSDWLRDNKVAEMDTFVHHIQRDRRLMAESIRESAVVQVDCGDFAAAARLLFRSLTLNPASGLAWRSMLYLGKAWSAGVLG